MLALRDRSRVAPDFLVGFRRFQRSRARRRGGESRRGRGGGLCPRDRLASQVRWSGVLREPWTTDPCQSSGPRRVGFRDGSRQVPEYAASRTSRGAAAEPTSQKLTMTRGARGPAPAGATWRPGAGLGVSRCAHRASDTGMDPCHRPQAGARDPRRAARPTVHRPGHRRRTPRRRAQRATLDPQLRIPVSRCDRESRIPGSSRLIPAYPGLKLGSGGRPYLTRRLGRSGGLVCCSG